MLRGLTAVLTVVPALLLGARPARADEGYGATVEAIDNAFDQQVIRIDPGRSVEWTMAGNAHHTVTADDGSYDSGALAPGSGFEPDLHGARRLSLLLPLPRLSAHDRDRRGRRRRPAGTRRRRRSRPGTATDRLHRSAGAAGL
jgi:hypothetical protein